MVVAFCLCFGFAVPARAQTTLAIDSLDGEVTQHEVDTFINYINATPIPTPQWNGTSPDHNYLADFEGGRALEATNDLYVITGDIPSLSSEHTQLLNLAIKWSDTRLAYRNDLALGEHRVMWTGNIDPVWPPNAPTAADPTYAGCEVTDTIGHIAYTAYNILKTPSIWSSTVPDGDPYSHGPTYLDRARTYVSMLEFSMSNYFNKYFIDPNTLLIAPPNSSAWSALNENVDAWNRQIMFLSAYQRLGQIHEILEDNPSLAAMYKTIVKNSTDAFVKNALPRTAPDASLPGGLHRRHSAADANLCRHRCA